MYDDFKRRVCDGRGIDRDVVEQVAGGRVMSGLRAFEIVAPPELVKQVKGIEDPLPAGPDSDKGKPSLGGDDGEDKVAAVPNPTGTSPTVATLPSEQETSPFAVPVVPEAAANSEAPTSSVLEATEAAHSPADASSTTTTTADVVPRAVRPSDLATETETKAESEPERPKSLPPAAQNGAAGLYDYVPGPFGRGLVDGLGGLRDSAIYACQLFVSFPAPREREREKSPSGISLPP